MKEKNLNKIQNKLRAKFLNKGVKMIAPDTVFFSNDTKIGKNVVIDPYVVILKKVKIGDNVIISSFSHIEDVVIDKNVSIGPYARIRPGTIIKSGSFAIIDSALTGFQPLNEENAFCAPSIFKNASPDSPEPETIGEVPCIE